MGDRYCDGVEDQLGNISTNLNALEDLMKCFVRNFLNAMLRAKSALMFCKYVMESQSVMIILMKMIVLKVQTCKVYFHLRLK